MWLPVIVGAWLFSCGGSPNSSCVAAGDTFSVRQEGADCCDGLSSHDAFLIVDDDYEGDDLPEGCGADATPPTVKVCLACGDGTCDPEFEHRCNCPEDCEATQADGPTAGGACTTVGNTFSVRQRGARCCEDLVRRDAFLIVDDDYEGDDLPDGCGADGTPPTIKVCLACGDGLCDQDTEHFCNCPEDCDSPGTSG